MFGCLYFMGVWFSVFLTSTFSFQSYKKCLFNGSYRKYFTYLYICSLFLIVLSIHTYMKEGDVAVKKWHLRIRNWMVDYLALPSDVLLELPRLTMIGNFHLYIENHKGLETYSETELKLKTTNGYVQILGSSFVLKQMFSDEILLEGEIEKINYISAD